MSLLHTSVMTVLPHLPKAVMRRLSARYIAGETLQEALATLEGLARRDHPGILDILGEGVRDEAAARAALGHYLEGARALSQRKLNAYISVKPTHFGLAFSESLARELYRELARELGRLGLFLRVEMEDHPTTDATLRVFEALRAEFTNVGIVLQSRLFRTPADIKALAPGPLDVRMVKGIYLEPAAIAHVDPEAIRGAYVECCRMLFERGARISLATHDEGLGARVLELAQRTGVAPERHEFQVLLGVREALWRQWQEAGQTVRVYVPYGPEWLAYSLRRLKKNPQILGHVMRATLRMG